MRPATCSTTPALILALFLAACGPAESGGGGSDGGGGPDVDGGVVDPGRDAGAPAITVCLPGCTAAADCVQGAGMLPAYDADNYACEAGVCRYTGCRSDAECPMTPGSARPPRCAMGAEGVPVCQPGCAAPSDCAQGGGTLPAYDADNYACEAGVCRYTGCLTDDECAAIPGGMPYVCRDPGTGLRVCVPSCASPADCVSGTGLPAFDADNYACEAGACRYTGCRADAECAGLGSSAYVCR